MHDSSVGSSGRRNKSHGSRSCSSSPAQPPEWAKQLLEQLQMNAAELKGLQNKLASSSTKVAKKQRAPDPNKKQYELNQDVVEKIDGALESVDANERSAKLNEGTDLLLERNKHNNYVNQHLGSCKFKYEDVRKAAGLFHKGLLHCSAWHGYQLCVRNCNFSLGT